MTGEWVERPRVWSDTNVEHCPVCGCLIPRRAWRFGGETPLEVCTPACEELYETYYKPTHGALADDHH
ncbi:MAG: hypothetical protein QOI43_2631 [Gaiellales bacterium]|nr:hypothetical protein [Gaiellales bacterium]